MASSKLYALSLHDALPIYDIARHGVPFLVVIEYFWYFTPYLIYQLVPLAALVSILVALGMMSKNNEIVACKARSEEHTSELQSRFDLVCRLLLEKKNKNKL